MGAFEYDRRGRAECSGRKEQLHADKLHAIGGAHLTVGSYGCPAVTRNVLQLSHAIT